MPLDPAGLAIAAFIAGAVFNAIVGIVTTEVQARRAVARANGDRVRQHWFEALQRLKTDALRRVMWRVATLANDDAEVERIGYLATAEWDIDWRLVGDQSALEAYWAIDEEFAELIKTVNPVPDDLLSRIGVAWLKLADAVDDQELRVVAGNDPIILDRGRVRPVDERGWLTDADGNSRSVSTQ